MCVTISFKFLEQIARISLNEYYTIKDIPKVVLLNFLHSIIITWRTREIQGRSDTSGTYVRILKLLLSGNNFKKNVFVEVVLLLCVK